MFLLNEIRIHYNIVVRLRMGTMPRGFSETHFFSIFLFIQSESLLRRSLSIENLQEFQLAKTFRFRTRYKRER